MFVESQIDPIRDWTLNARSGGVTIGLVPTMGALHAGHMSLVEQAKRNCDRCVATIFVNPTQFAAGEDLDKYPRTLDQDLQLLKDAGADAVFTPTPDVIYPEGFSTFVQAPEVSATLEGKARPTHFRGVATVVLKLFQIIPATNAYFGQKDYQQSRVIQQMVHDLNVNIRIEVCPIIREADGLAMSSRNQYLSPEQRGRSVAIFEALKAVERQVAGGQTSIEHLEACMRDRLAGAVDAIDYAVIADAATLTMLSVLDRPAVALIAVRVGATRLIDNLLLNAPE